VKYHYRCHESGCKSHTQTLIDCEVGEAGRKWPRRYPESEIPTRIREKFLTQLCGEDRDTHFFVGNQKRLPARLSGARSVLAQARVGERRHLVLGVGQGCG
jgi:hypothetical protein